MEIKVNKLSESTLDERINQVKEIYKKEILAFKDIGHKFLNWDISNAEFKAASGGMGVYAQRGGQKFMLRLRILSGVLDIKTFKLIQSFAREYSLDFIHFTTRQTIQLHNLKFDDLIEIMEKSLESNLISRGGGGNFPRNVSLSPLSGVEKEEAFDVTPYAVLVNKYFVSQINTYELPRKFKAAFSNNGMDSANASIADIGFLAVKMDGKEFFEVYIGGSLGPNGDISVPYDELIDPKDILYHIETALHLFKEEGDYQNRGKARMRFIIKRMGKEAFLKCYKEHLKYVKETLKLDYELSNDYAITVTDTSSVKLKDNPNVIPQKQKNLYSVVIHPQGGNLTTKDLNSILHFLEKLPDIQIRLSMEESMLVRNLTIDQVKELLALTKEIRNSTRLSRSVSCIGTPICQIGIQSSQNLLANILNYFKEKDFTEDILPSIHISGCTNSCARHQVSQIGFQGKKKRIDSEIKDAYSLHIDGTTTREDTHIARECGDIIADEIPVFLYELAILLKDRNLEFKEFIKINRDEFENFLGKYLV